MSKWLWFYDLTQRKLGSILSRYGFKQLNNKEYEEDDNKDRNGSINYASASDVKIGIDILTRYEESTSVLIYVVRVGIARDDLKQWLYPNIRSETKDVNLWLGWKCYDENDVEQAFDDIAEGLERYLAENLPI